MFPPTQCWWSGSGSVCFWASWIRIRYSEVWIRNLLSSRKNSKKNLDSYCFVTSFGPFIVPSKSNKQKKIASWRSEALICGSWSVPKCHGSTILLLLWLTSGCMVLRRSPPLVKTLTVLCRASAHTTLPFFITVTATGLKKGNLLNF